MSACQLISPLDRPSVQMYSAKVRFELSLMQLDEQMAAQRACSEVHEAPCGCQAQIRTDLAEWAATASLPFPESFTQPYVFECWGNREHVYPLVELVMRTLVHVH